MFGVLILGAFAVLRIDWHPTGDVALLEVRLLDVAQHFPQLGVYSRMGWFHPGPAFLLWEWLPYRLLGPMGLMAGMLVWQFAAIALAWWVARGIDISAGAWILLGGCILLLANGSQTIAAPWNPYIAIAGGLTLMVCAWGAAQRSRLGSLALLPVGSMLVQSHVGAVLLVLLVTAAGIVLGLVRGRTQRTRTPRLALAWVVGVAIALLMWLPPLWQQLHGEPGNLSLLLEQSGEGKATGFGFALGAMSHLFSIAPMLNSGALSITSTPTVPWLLILPIAATVIAARSRSGVALRAMGVCWSALVAAMIALASIRGLTSSYLVAWLPSVGVTTLALSCWVLARAATNRWWVREDGSEAGAIRGRAGLRQATLVSLLALAVASVVAWGLAVTPPRDTESGRTLDYLAAQLVRDSGGQASYVEFANDRNDFAGGEAFYTWTAVPAGALRRGLDIAVPEDLAWRVAGTLPSDPAGRRRYVVRAHYPESTPGVGERVVAVYDPFTPEEWRRMRSLEQECAQPNPPAKCSTPVNGVGDELAAISNGRVAVELIAKDDPA